MCCVIAVNSFKIRKDFRNKGLGTRVFADIFNVLKERLQYVDQYFDGIVIISVLKVGAVDFYKKMGFSQPPMCFNSWAVTAPPGKEEEFELLGCRCEDFFASPSFKKLAVSFPSFI